jgi:hypothetical protein
MSAYDIVGLIGVAVILAAYAATTLGRVDPRGAPALALNALGPGLILVSLSQRFNLSAAIVEAVWGLIALAGLARLALRRLRAAQPSK